ncbi:DJ-1/PfpI family protein [Variovorax sp. HJSM1_2]|uniref:DJ-1/PfpI family protein n=1 Tax=Variovorax sp. HJSM1_2 TaxID=3366263 RepID=UPI003BBA3D8E
MTLQVQILAFDDVEALDLAGPYEVFTTATRMGLRVRPDAAPRFNVVCVARDNATVRARAGLSIVAEHSFANAPRADVLIVPGGVTTQAEACAATRAWIAQASAQAQITASVCTGVFLLAESGVLQPGEPVTTHWEDMAELRQRYPWLKVEDAPRWVDNGRIVTSAGISAGIDMSLHLVARLASPALAERTARQMDYPYRPEPL